MAGLVILPATRNCSHPNPAKNRALLLSEGKTIAGTEPPDQPLSRHHAFADGSGSGSSHERGRRLPARYRPRRLELGPEGDR